MIFTSEPHNLALSSSNFQDANAYERFMGRWSRLLAPQLISFGGPHDGDRVLDVGCGTGSLMFELPALANVLQVTGIDMTESYVAAARARNTDPRITIDLGDARTLPYATGSFDRAYSSLVLHFIPDAAQAVAELRRVVRLGGSVTAASSSWTSISAVSRPTPTMRASSRTMAWGPVSGCCANRF